jgi:dipeptidyl aminopeptidase/acylaminoacyl peptidase
MSCQSSFRWIALLAAFVSIGLLNAQEPAKKKPLAVDDLYLMEGVRSPARFPKEEKLVYERVWIDAKTKQERHSLWLVTDKRENRKPLEKDEPDGRSPVVSPDGQWIAFLSTRPRSPETLNALGRPPVPPYSDPAVDLWLYHVKTAKVLPILMIGRAPGRVFHDGFYGRIAFSPDSTKLVFVADDATSPRTKEEIENDVEIVRPDQGEGYTGYGPAQIWIADLVNAPAADARGSSKPTDKITRLTKDDVWYGDPQWSPDGKSLVVVANKSKDRESVRFSINKNFDLYLIDVASKKQTQLTTNPGPDVSPRWSPDGKQIAYLSSPRNGPHRDVMNLTILDIGQKGGSSLVHNHHHPKADRLHRVVAFPLPQDAWEGDVLYYFAEEGVSATWWNVEPKTGREMWPLPQFIRRFAKRNDLTPTGGQIPENRMIGESERLSWKNEDQAVEGILTIPPPEVTKPPYKLIVYPHGGPHGRNTLGFDFTVQLFAAQGYAVFQPNFRGSTGYGKKFLDADRLDLGGGDMRDILTGIDKLVKDGLVDPKRQFVYGISYGGFMASWLVSHTHQFRAAVAQNAVTDMNMMYGLSDLQSWTHWELGGAPWEQPERYRKHSPLTYADKVKTPTLILHARDDRRCPLPMGKAFHQALLANEVPTQMVIYPNEGHGIRQPRHREDVYRRVLAWFAKHDVK